MQRFGYVRANTISDAIAWLNESGIRSRPLAGGTDLLLLLRAEPGLCDRVVDITRVPELQRIEREGDWVTIGATATFSEVLENPIVNATAPVLVQACRQVGAVQIRNIGTLGGNVANAAACADSLPALVCLDATAWMITPDREQEWPVAELVKGPNRTMIPAGGLLAWLRYRAPLSGSRSTFLKLGRRNAMAISRLTVAALGRLDDTGRIAEARLVLGAATPQTSRLGAVEAALIGQFPGSPLYAAAAQIAVSEVTRLSGRRWSSEYKEPALMAMVERALRAVFEDGI